MARPKGAKNKKVVFKDSTVEEVVETEIEFNCPIRGKVKQKVKVKKLKKMEHQQKVFTGMQSIIDDIEKKESEDDSDDTESAE